MEFHTIPFWTQRQMLKHNLRRTAIDRPQMRRIKSKMKSLRQKLSLTIDTRNKKRYRKNRNRSYKSSYSIIYIPARHYVQKI